MLDTGAPRDVVGDVWLRQYPQVMLSALQPAANRFALGR